MFNQGFSFIEVFAALLILSMSLIVLMESQGRSVDLVERARSLDYATTLASAKMTELVQTINKKGIKAVRESEEGEFDTEKFEGYKWKYWIVEVPTPDFAALMKAFVGGGEEDSGQEANNASLFEGPLQSIGKVWGEALRELHVEVTWQEGQREQSYELLTHVIDQTALAQVKGTIGALSGGRGGT